MNSSIFVSPEIQNAVRSALARHAGGGVFRHRHAVISRENEAKNYGHTVLGPKLTMMDLQELADLAIDEIVRLVPNPQDRRLTRHYLSGSGQEVTLSELGLFQAVQAYAERSGNAVSNFRQQILRSAQAAPDGPLYDSFNNSYDFGDVLFSFGRVTLRGDFSGEVKSSARARRVYGVAEIEFYDRFEDPADLVHIKQDLRQFIERRFGVQVPDWRQPDITGTPFDITGSWQISVDERF